MQFKLFTLLLAVVAYVEASPVFRNADFHQDAALSKSSSSSQKDCANSTVSAANNSTNMGTGEKKSSKNGTNSNSNKNSNNSTSVDNSSNSNKNSDNSTSVDNSSNSNNTSSNNNSASGTSTALVASRTRACDQGDQSLAAGMQANVVIGLGQQAAVITLQGLLGQGNSSDFQAGVDRLNQFMKTSALQIQMTKAIADDASFAQDQLTQLADQSAQQKLIDSLTGDASDNSTLSQLLDSFVTSTGTSQDAAVNALIDCFLPVNTVSG